jgi:2'-5' RNA ligase
MSDIKRRQLGNNKNTNNNKAPQNRTGNSQQARPAQPQGQRPQNNNNPNRRPGQRPQQRSGQRVAIRPPPPPPAYFQRDLLLLATLDATSGVEQVRAKFDPLSKKLPAHITLIFPEPAKKIETEFLKKLTKDELPSLSSITFSQIIVHDEMYLWLIPDDEGRQKLIQWHKTMLGALTSVSPEHTQDEYAPHITLGYVPRRLTPEEAVASARELIPLPVAIDFNKVILEEFSENQVSTSVDTLALSNA